MTNLLAPIAQPSGLQISRQSAALIDRSVSGKGTAPQSAAHQAAQEFETVFLNNMLQSMFEGISTEAPFGGGYGEKVFRSMMVNEYAKNIVSSGGIGLADDIAREILAQQEGGDK